MRFVYYQPLEIDTGIARYVYPLEEDGTDELAKSFWTRTETVDGTFSANVEVKSAWPVADLRVPGNEASATIELLGESHARIRVESQQATVSRDPVVYYRLEDDLPGRVEVVAYRPDRTKPGTFMAVVTPGLDLQPLASGADYVLVLDVSGSMSSGKLSTLTHGVSQVIGDLDPNDRFRVITFNNSARDLTRGFEVATPENVARSLEQISRIAAGGGTNLYEGIELAVRKLDADRATSLILVTDAVTNTGIVDPRAFHKLMGKYDVRLFGFLLGNSGSWPLMRTIAEASGGFHSQVSNADDILGQILLAKSKVTHESLHRAALKIRGVETEDTTGEVIGKVHRGQQLVLFGRYRDSGHAKMALEATLTGKDEVYETTFTFPEFDDRHPELERLWALAMIEELEDRAHAGLLDGDEMREAIRGLGVDYQLVTDETSMIVLDDASFERHGIERRNRARSALEKAAQSAGASATIANHRVDRDRPTFDLPTPSLGGGPLDPVSGVVLLGLAAAGSARKRS